MTTRKLFLLVALLSAVTVTPLHAQFLKEDTTVTINFGPFLDALDGVTAETGITAATMEPNIKLSKNGAAFALRNSTTDPAHDDTGWYRIELDATDTSTPGKLIVKVHYSTVHVPVWMEFQVVSANTYDSLVSGSGALPANVTQISGGSTAADNAESFFDGTGYGPLLWRSTLINAGSPTTLELASTPTHANSFLGCRVVVRDVAGGTGAFTGVITDYSSGEFTVNVDGAAAFTVANGDIVEILAPAFGGEDRTAAAAVKAKTDSLTFTVPNEVNANTRYWTGGLIPTQNVTGVPEVDITKVLGTDASAVSGAIDVNVVKLIGNEIELTPP